MAKRYYVCDIIGEGTDDSPFRPAVEPFGVDWVGTIPTGPDGRPTSAWCLVLVASRNHAQLRGQQGIDPLPDFPLDGKVSGIEQATKVSMRAALQRRGLPAADIVDGKDGYREVIRDLGRRLEPNFDENTFDISDI